MKGKKITGIIPAVITPVDKSGALDTAQIKPMLDILLAKGAEAFFAIGSTGNFPLFSKEERKKAAEAYVKAVDGRVPLCVHVGSDTELLTLELAEHAGKAGADSIAAVPPYYFKYDGPALCGYFARVAAVNPDLPFYIYNIPMFAASDVQPALLKKMKAEIPNLAGIKDTTQDFTRFLDYIDATGSDFGCLMGSDAMCIAAMGAGGAGAISAMASHNPELITAIFTLWRKGDHAEAQRLQFLAARMRLILQKLPFFTARIAIMRLRGISQAYPRNPMRELSEDENKLLISTLKAWEEEFNFPLLSKV